MCLFAKLPKQNCLPSNLLAQFHKHYAAGDSGGKLLVPRDCSKGMRKEFACLA